LKNEDGQLIDEEGNLVDESGKLLQPKKVIKLTATQQKYAMRSNKLKPQPEKKGKELHIAAG